MHYCDGFAFTLSKLPSCHIISQKRVFAASSGCLSFRCYGVRNNQMKAIPSTSATVQQTFAQAVKEKKKQSVSAFFFTFPSFAKFILCMFDSNIIFYYPGPLLSEARSSTDTGQVNYLFQFLLAKKKLLHFMNCLLTFYFLLPYCGGIGTNVIN
jgi:hypothetical protein